MSSDGEFITESLILAFKGKIKGKTSVVCETIMQLLLVRH